MYINTQKLSISCYKKWINAFKKLKCLYVLEYYNLHRILTSVNFRAECVAVDCGKPGSINNARFHGTETTFGNSWSLICDEG